MCYLRPLTNKHTDKNKLTVPPSSTASERTQSTAGGLTNTNHNKKPARSKRQLDFLGAGLAFEAGGGGEFEPAPPAKVMISRKTLATGHAWNEANFKTPVDR